MCVSGLDEVTGSGFRIKCRAVASGGAKAPSAGDGTPNRRRLPGVNRRPGSVKQARLQAGLSLAQLGKGHVTAPAIYLIENARTRPSLPTLEHIARRTGRPIEFFLAQPAGATDDSQAALIELEALVADARNQEAIALGLSLLESGSSAFRLGRIRFLLGRAYIGASQPERAASLLAEARSHFEAVNDGLMLAECIGTQAELANMTHNPDAVALAEMALKACRALRPVPAPTESRLLGVLAAAHMANHDHERAIAAYEKAIEVGAAMSGLQQLARLYGALGADSLELAERLEEGATIAEAHVWLGRVADRKGRPEEADRQFSDAIRGFEALGMRERLLQCHGIFAEMLERRGELARAYEHMKEALQASRPGLLRREHVKEQLGSA